MLKNGIPIEHFACYTLRHAFATRATENGMKPQEMLLMENLFIENLAM